jgi:hypothetical protein
MNHRLLAALAALLVTAACGKEGVVIEMHRIDKDGIGPVIGTVTAGTAPSGILGQGGIFPEFVYPDAPKNGADLDDLFNGKLANPEAYAKALVYSFIAGFAERFVPNILARIVQPVDEKP